MSTSTPAYEQWTIIWNVDSSSIPEEKIRGSYSLSIKMRLVKNSSFQGYSQDRRKLPAETSTTSRHELRSDQSVVGMNDRE